MKLKLPEHLPYDYVDELLDDTYEFITNVYEQKTDEDGEFDPTSHMVIEFIHHSCRRKKGLKVSAYARPMFEEFKTYYVGAGIEENEEGYLDAPGDFGMVWTSEPLTEEEIDKWLYAMSPEWATGDFEHFVTVVEGNLE